jgi:hypothetical protein
MNPLLWLIRKNHRRSDLSANIRKTVAVREQKSPSAKREGVSTGADASHLRRNFFSSDRIWHLAVEHVSSTGCRGFIGPFPLPLWMSAAVACSSGS